MPDILINNRLVQANTGETIIEVADREDIYIPRFCYHKHLSIAANCRMCLVEVNGKQVLPACATPINPGMQIMTTSKQAINAQKAVMEFLLVNHPLDCPICDQGGECELQDLSMDFGIGKSNYLENKRTVADVDIGPLITTNMTRCIHCTRCVRFGEEIAGVPDFGVINRGNSSEIRTYLNRTVTSNLSGNLIDICPVGALNSKPYAYQTRSWELTAYPTIAPHDSLGSNLHLHVRDNKVFRTVARSNDNINSAWISDRDRFSYLAINSEDRILDPMIKVGGNWEKTSWSTALAKASIKIKEAETIGGIINPSATTEEQYLWQHLLRTMGSNNVDCRIRQQDFSVHATPKSINKNITPEYIVNSQCILLVGVDLDSEQPVIGTYIRQAIDNGAKVTLVNPVYCKTNLAIEQNIVLPNQQLLSWLQKFADSSASQNTIVISGSLLVQHPQAALCYGAIDDISSSCIHLTTGSNMYGAWKSGCLPFLLPNQNAYLQPGMNLQEMLINELDAYLLYGIEPEIDCLFAQQASTSLAKAKAVIVFTSFTNRAMYEYADVILPIATFAENSGSYTNAFGQVQSFSKGIAPLGETLPGWQAIASLAAELRLRNFNFTTLTEVSKSMHAAKFEQYANQQQTSMQSQLIHIWSQYNIDPLVRRSMPLQIAQQKQEESVHGYALVNQELADKLSLLAGDKLDLSKYGLGNMPVKLDPNIANGHIQVHTKGKTTIIVGEVNV